MALSSLLDIELSVPDPGSVGAFWERRGMTPTGGGVLGTEDRDAQIRLTEGPYRHLSELHIGCDTEQDLADIEARLDGLGLDSTISGTTLRCVDPVFNHRVVVEVTAPHPITPAQARALNPAGVRERINARAEAVVEDAPRPPRRLGHIVLGTPKLDEAYSFFFDGLGFRVSDQILNGVATFGRIESDHHNLLLHPGPTSYLNHYAMEMDDLDAVGKAGQAVLSERDDASVVGIGRHVLGSNIFWYLLDPAGNMFEFFSDIDQIIDDDVWDRDHRRLDWTPDEAPFAVWGPDAPEVFFNPADIGEIGAAREAAGLD